MTRETRQRKKQANQNRRRQEAALRGAPPRKRHLLAWVLGLLTLLALVAATVAANDGGTRDETDLAAKGCPLANGSSPKRTSFTAPPAMCIDAGRTYKAKLYTDVGIITIDLDTAKSPNAVNNFVFLARYHFFDGLAFHRVIPDLLVQGGDPKGDGIGGPGYTIPDDELPRSARAYTAGSVVMHSSGADPGGSQFFIVVSEEGGKRLAKPTHSAFGRVVDGLDVVRKIASDGGPPPSGTPKVLHRMEVSILESP